jgi:hypothetical protein
MSTSQWLGFSQTVSNVDTEIMGMKPDMKVKQKVDVEGFNAKSFRIQHLTLARVADDGVVKWAAGDGPGSRVRSSQHETNTLQLDRDGASKSLSKAVKVAETFIATPRT